MFGVAQGVGEEVPGAGGFGVLGEDAAHFGKGGVAVSHHAEGVGVDEAGVGIVGREGCGVAPGCQGVVALAAFPGAFAGLDEELGA